MNSLQLTAAERRLLEEMRIAVRRTPFERVTDQEAERRYAGLPAGAHSNAIEGNPLTAVEYAFALMMIEERVPLDRTAEFTVELMRREDAAMPGRIADERAI